MRGVEKELHLWIWDERDDGTKEERMSEVGKG